MGMKKIMGMLALMALAVSANADTLVYSDSFSGTPNYTDVLSFQLFDSTLGTLESITWELTFAIDGGQLSVDNESATETATVTVDLGATATIQSDRDLGLYDFGVTLENTETFVLAVDDNDDGTTVQTTGGDYATMYGSSLTGSESDYIDADDFDLWQSVGGTGANDVTVNIASILDFGGNGGVSGSFSPLTSSGELTLTYNYVAIPEPATIGMMALVAGGALIIRRRFY
jgi:hypothetical protein